GRQMLKILRESDGDAVAVSERAIVEAQHLLARLEGIWTSPEGAALMAALGILKDRGRITADARVAVILTGAGIHYTPPEVATPSHPEGRPEQVLGQFTAALSRPWVSDLRPISHAWRRGYDPQRPRPCDQRRRDFPADEGDDEDDSEDALSVAAPRGRCP